MDLPITAELSVVSIPLRRPMRTAYGTLDRRTTVLVCVDGEPAGWGEAAPYPGQDEPIEALIEAARQGVATPTLAAALDEGVADIEARHGAVPLSVPPRRVIPMSVAVGIEGAVARVDELVDRGVTAFKLKVAPGATGHVAAIRRRHPDVVLGADGNQSFSDLRGGAWDDLVDSDLAYVEELFARGAERAARDFAETGIPHFADESVRTVADIEAVLASDLFGGVTIKPGRLGWSGALTARTLARAADTPWRASGLLETGLGRAYTDVLAAEADAFVSDVAPAEWFLTRDIVERSYVDGCVVLPEDVGVGVRPVPDLVSAVCVSRIDVTITTTT